MPNDMLIPRQGDADDSSNGGIPGWDSLQSEEPEEEDSPPKEARQSVMVRREPTAPPLHEPGQSAPAAATGAVCCPGIEELFDPEFFKALSDPARLDILVTLSQLGRPCTVSELAEASPRDLSVVSRHLSALRDAGIVNSIRRGKQVFYWVRVADVAERMRGIADSLAGLSAQYSSLNDDLIVESRESVRS